MMTSLQSVQESLHSDIVALDTRFDDLPSFEQFLLLVERQQQLQQDFNAFNTTFTGFTDHFYSVYPTPVVSSTVLSASAGLPSATASAAGG